MFEGVPGNPNCDFCTRPATQITGESGQSLVCEAHIEDPEGGSDITKVIPPNDRVTLILLRALTHCGEHVTNEDRELAWKWVDDANPYAGEWRG